jgi:hypothetical protein
MPALLAGTSSEYLGRRPLPRILRERKVVFVLGPEGVGKTCVAQRIADPWHGSDAAATEAIVLDTPHLNDALIDCVRECGWTDRILRARAVILDGPVWLKNRPGAVSALSDLLRLRAEAGLRTCVCQDDADGSVRLLMDRLPSGSYAVIGLRFPKGERGRLRFARRACDELGLPRTAARGTELLEPGGYERVVQHLLEVKKRG